MTRDVELKPLTGEILTDWQAAIELAGLSQTKEGIRFLSESAGFAKTFAWELLGGYGRPSVDQARRTVEACQPLIEAREKRGLIKDI